PTGFEPAISSVTGRRGKPLHYGASIFSISYLLEKSSINRIIAGVGFEPTTSGLRSEEHTSELQSRFDLVCRLLLEKKNQPLQDHKRFLHDTRLKLNV